MNIIDDATLLKMAEAEILGEAKRAAVRHSIAGVSGWQPCPKPNKVFLTNTLLQAISRNRILSRKKSEKNDKDSKTKERSRKLLQSGKNERTNFVYQKPEKKKEKIVMSTISDKLKNTSNKDHKPSTIPKEMSDKSVSKQKDLNKT